MEGEARFVSLTDKGENDRLQKLVAPKARAKGQAIIDSYFEVFELQGKAPDRDDQMELDKKLENIFRGGFGDYTGSLGIGIRCEVQDIEKELCEQMRLRAERMALQKGRGTSMDKLKIRGSQVH